jgi:hypothetical protein
MEQIVKKPELKPDKRKSQEVREFVKEIHLKLKSHKPQDNKAISLYDMITQ